MDNSNEQAAVQEWYKQECQKFQTTAHTQETLSSSDPSESTAISSASNITGPISTSRNIKSKPSGKAAWTSEEDEMLMKAVAAYGRSWRSAMNLNEILACH